MYVDSVLRTGTSLVFFAEILGMFTGTIPSWLLSPKLGLLFCLIRK